jgi:hypothetical protein
MAAADGGVCRILICKYTPEVRQALKEQQRGSAIQKAISDRAAQHPEN